jgi:serine/threonine protein kinase
MEKLVKSSYTQSVYVMPMNKKLGAGAFGEVYKGYEDKTREEVAIKCLFFDQIERGGPELVAALGDEVNILQEFMNKPCPHIIKIYDCFKSDKYVYVVLELCNQGTLEGEMKQMKMIPEDTARPILRQVLTGIRFLHDNNITHRDIKPENVFKKDGIYKLGDFGFATTKKIMDNYAGTPLYMAPELNDDDLAYDNKVDIWALGCVFYEMLFGVVPFKNTKDIPVKEVIIPSSPIISPECKDLVLKMLSKDRKKRYSAYECLKHPFFKGEPTESNYNPSPSPKNGLMQSNLTAAIKNMLPDSEEMKHSIDNSITDYQSKAIKDKLDDYYLGNESYIAIIRNLRLSFKDNYVISVFLLIKRCYYKLYLILDCLACDKYPAFLLPTQLEFSWPEFIQTSYYEQFKIKLQAFVTGQLIKLYDAAYEKVKTLPQDLNKSFLNKALSKDITQGFTASFKICIEDEIQDLLKKSSTNAIDKMTALKCVLDLKHALFIEDHIATWRMMNIKSYQKDRELLTLSDLERAIKSETFFNKYFVDFPQYALKNNEY